MFSKSKGFVVLGGGGCIVLFFKDNASLNSPPGPQTQCFCFNLPDVALQVCVCVCARVLVIIRRARQASLLPLK